MLSGARVEPPDAVLLDIMLPGDDGLVLLQALRGNAATENLPVMMLTAKGTEFDKVVGLDAGADDYLAKPFGMMELISRVNALLRRAAVEQGAAEEVAEPSDLMAVGAISCRRPPAPWWRMARKSTSHARSSTFCARSWRTRGRVLTREQLLEQVWGVSFVGETRTVDMHVKTLRPQAGRGGPRFRRGRRHRARRGLSLEEERLMSATSASQRLRGRSC
ncbi:MAG: response regulator transcription factor [Collinsella sp.]